MGSAAELDMSNSVKARKLPRPPAENLETWAAGYMNFKIKYSHSKNFLIPIDSIKFFNPAMIYFNAPTIAKSITQYRYYSKRMAALIARPCRPSRPGLCSHLRDLHLQI